MAEIGTVHLFNITLCTIFLHFGDVLLAVCLEQP